MSGKIGFEKITLGVCYYPEHWDESIWEDDLDRMKEHGIDVVRVGEFAWNKFEPTEKNYNFSFFDRFLNLAYQKGMKIIFCTPTATPPAWLTNKYPEVLNASADGTLYRHGMRRHYNYNSMKYRELTQTIVENIASHYGKHPSIIGWQIDNELNCEIDVFYSEADNLAFREYLKKKFHTLENLNQAMGTTFWNQTYTSWEEVYLKRNLIHDANNPHLSLEEKRFFSQSAISFCKLQSDIIKKYISNEQFITTNGMFDHLDYHEMTDKSLDFITFDSYPNFAFDVNYEKKDAEDLNDRLKSKELAIIRSISPIFGLMEQQSGAGGWDSKMRQPAPKPGQMRLWTFQSIAHGADFISYFRWRTCWIGSEIYWHGLNDYSNLPNRRLAELNKTYNDISKLADVAGAYYNADIAYVKDYANQWDGEQDKWHGPIDNYSEENWFAAAQLKHIPMDYVFIRNSETKRTRLEDLSKYKLLIYPHATILTEHTAQLLKEYVENGGILIMGCRTGYKDEYGRCPMMAMPGFATDICNVQVSDYTHLGPTDDTQYAIWDGVQIEAPIFNDILVPKDGAEVIAQFKGNYYDGLPALVVNKLGIGKSYYFGAGFSRNTSIIFLEKLGFASPYSHLIDLPKEVELAIRTKDDKNFLFVLNYMPYSVKINIKKKMFDIIKGEFVEGILELEKFGVMVLEYVKK